MTDRRAEIHSYELDTDNYYSVSLRDESGRIVSTQTMSNINEAKRVKENWENGEYQYITES